MCHKRLIVINVVQKRSKELKNIYIFTFLRWFHSTFQELLYYMSSNNKRNSNKTICYGYTNKNFRITYGMVFESKAVEICGIFLVIVKKKTSSNTYRVLKSDE
ncbi:hypothetical protein AHF37_08226 [Paragonimus kellicotti]|nr:hypothetical protein AHF37_08226 [Paragonimus kellicotti]